MNSISSSGNKSLVSGNVDINMNRYMLMLESIKSWVEMKENYRLSFFNDFRNNTKHVTTRRQWKTTTKKERKREWKRRYWWIWIKLNEKECEENQLAYQRSEINWSQFSSPWQPIMIIWKKYKKTMKILFGTTLIWELLLVC